MELAFNDVPLNNNTWMIKVLALSQSIIYHRVRILKIYLYSLHIYFKYFNTR